MEVVGLLSAFFIKVHLIRKMELFIALGLPLVLLVGLTFLFISEGIPPWIQNLDKNSSTIWNFGIIAMSTMTVIIYLAKR